MKSLKKITLSLVIFLMAVGVKEVSAQMAAATPIKWDVTKVITIPMEQYDVWEILNDVERLQALSNGFATSIKIIDANSPVEREVEFADASKRLETISQTDIINKFMVIKFDPKALPEGIKAAEIAVFTKSLDDDQAQISWNFKVEGGKKEKAALMEKIKAEFENYAIGFEKAAKEEAAK